jgi:hypothetical protein
VAIYELVSNEPLKSPVLIVALDGWTNAGSAGTTAAQTLSEGGTELARFDGDALFDYRQSRPTLDFLGGVMQKLEWPELTLHKRRYGEHDLLILTGTEPNWSWKRLGSEVAGLARTLGVEEEISLGGIPWATPHTRPVSIVNTASDRSRVASTEDLPDGLLRVPASAVSVIEFAVAQGGIPTSGFWARVPHYVGPSHLASGLALIEKVGGHLGIELPLRRLAEQAADQRAEIDAAVAARPEVASLVQQLEEMIDTQKAVSGEQLAAEIERYLRRQNGDRGGSD